MAHPNARLIPIADFTKATLQAPAFLRAAGAAEEMEDIVASLRGRPIPRKGYEVVDTSGLSIGTEAGEYTEGDQIVVAYWLGDEDTPDGIKRLYYFDRNASYVQDEIGRLLYLVGRGLKPKIIDIKENIAYDWKMTRPEAGRDSAFNMGIVGQGELNVNRNLRLIERGDVERGGISFDWSPDGYGVYFDIRAETDITHVFIIINAANGEPVRVLFEGFLAQGGHRFFWDGRNEHGQPVAAPGTYAISFIMEEQPGIETINTTAETPEGQNFLAQFITGFVDGATLGISYLIRLIADISDKKARSFLLQHVAPTPSKFHLSGQFRYVCFTYFNEDLNIESRPSKIFKERVYFWHTENESPPAFDVVVTPGLSGVPNWATSINIYVSDVPTTLEEYTEAIETGFDFYRLGSVERINGNFVRGLTNYMGEIDSEARLLDSFEHDGPVDGFHVIGAYGVGLWGAAKNRVYFNKIGRDGEQRLYALPSENALVPHSFPLSRSGQSPILHIHPASSESGLLVFKRDALHIIKGSGVISGLYDPQTIVEVDIDASHVIDGIGTMSPRSVLTVGSAVYFVGSDNRFYQYGADWRGRVDVRDVGLPIQQYLEDFSVEELGNLVAFLHSNCYHLITPDRVLVLDMTRKYWTSASWQLKDAFWSRGGIHAESILYGILEDDTLVELFKGDTDDGEPIGGVWQSNPIAIPSESSITGVLCVHTTTPAPTLRCRVDVDDVEGEMREFIPDKSNDFRCGVHASGSRVAVRLESDEGFPLCDRVELEVFVVP